MKFIEKYIDAAVLRNCKPNWKKAFKYAKLMEEGEEFPPVKLYYTKEGHLDYNDGRHRVTAAKLSGKPLKIRMKIKGILND